MKKIFILFVIGLVCGPVAVQGQEKRSTVNFESHRGESFSVFIDGNLMNRMPQGRVMVGDVTDRTHEVVVVLKRPEQKAAVLRLLPSEPTVMVNVVYDERTEELMLYTPMQNRAESHEVVTTGMAAPKAEMVAVAAENPTKVVEARALPTVSDADVDAMIVRMKGQGFDSDRLALAKVIVASSNLTAKQIARLAETIDYSSSQVDFLKYAYSYCADKVNYYTTVDVLTFSSDKRKVLDYIATQK